MNFSLGSILYEDQYGNPPKNYGPHMLLLACVASNLGLDRFSLSRRVIPIPKKGNGKLKNALEKDASRLLNNGAVFAVFDEDHVRGCYELRQSACKRDILTAIQKNTPHEIQVVFLVRNVEDLLSTCLEVMGEPPFDSKPPPMERDRIFNKAAASTKAIHKAICEKSPSFERLVEKVTSWVQS